MSWRKTIVSCRLIDMGHFLGVALGGEHLHTIKEKSVQINFVWFVTTGRYYVDDVICINISGLIILANL